MNTEQTTVDGTAIIESGGHVETNHALESAKAYLQSIREKAEAFANTESDSLADDIESDVLSVEVRSGWLMIQDAQSAKFLPSEFKLLLCAGGPAVQIVGTLDDYCQPESSRIQYQDWGTPWTDLPLNADDEKALLVYCSHFYFGE